MSRDDEKPKGKISEVKKGLLVGFLIEGIVIIALGCLGTIMDVVWVALVFIGIFQLTYMIPALLIAKSRGLAWDFLKGMAFSALAIFLLNATCFGLALASLAASGPWFG